MTKDEYKTVREEIRCSDDAVYTYTLKSCERARNLGYGFPLYSIHIDMCEHISGRRTSAYTDELFSSEMKAVSFFEKLVRNLATPIDLAYVVEDEFS
ncbi:MAG: hypothetical protein J6Q69_05390 [Clostridia bacterium]|nr:hypothetical protein [Clostridia bacterium]